MRCDDDLSVWFLTNGTDPHKSRTNSHNSTVLSSLISYPLTTIHSNTKNMDPTTGTTAQNGTGLVMFVTVFAATIFLYNGFWPTAAVDELAADETVGDCLTTASVWVIGLVPENWSESTSCTTRSDELRWESKVSKSMCEPELTRPIVTSVAPLLWAGTEQGDLGVVLTIAAGVLLTDGGNANSGSKTVGSNRFLQRKLLVNGDSFLLIRLLTSYASALFIPHVYLESTGNSLDRGKNTALKKRVTSHK